MAIEIYTVMVISTRHITEDDARVLQKVATEEKTDPLLVIDYDYGFRLFVKNDRHDPCADARLSAAARECIALAGSYGCRWVEFDRDGPTYDGKEMFEW